MKNNDEQPIFTSRREGKRYIAESLPLQDAMILGVVPPQSGPGRLLPSAVQKPMSLVWLDMSKRPELRDLSRVHATEGEGEAIFKWVYIDEDKENCYFVLNVTMLKPVRETFRFPIRMQEWAALVDVISTTGTISILAGPPVAWRRLIKTMETPALLQMILDQARGDVTLEMSQDTVAELRRHYEAWVRRSSVQKAEPEETTNFSQDPVAAIESIISWNTEQGTCQECGRRNQLLSLVELYLPTDLYAQLLHGKGEEAKYTSISDVVRVALEQVRDQFHISQTRRLCEICLKDAFAGFTKKDTYETTRREIKQEAKGQKEPWTAIFYCLLLGGTSRHEILYTSKYVHLAASGLNACPSLHDLFSIGQDAARKHLLKST